MLSTWLIAVLHSVLREQWIRAKYERREFMGGAAKLTYLSGHKEGYMEKKGKEEKKFCKRRFVLDETDNKLSYFIKDDVRVLSSAEYMVTLRFCFVIKYERFIFRPKSPKPVCVFRRST